MEDRGRIPGNGNKVSVGAKLMIIYICTSNPGLFEVEVEFFSFGV